MSNEELIKVLRCEFYGDDECDKSDCPIWSELGCRNGIANRAAADALEAAEKRIADLGTALAACRVRAEKGHECRFDCDFYDWTVGTCGGECVMLCEAVRGEHDA